MVIITGLNTIDGIIFQLLLIIFIVYILIITIKVIVNKIKGNKFHINKAVFCILLSLLLLIPMINTISLIRSKFVNNKIIKEYEKSNYVTTDARELMEEFNINQENANLKYSGKIINILGNIFDTAQPKDYRPIKDASCLYYGDFTKDKIYITCYFNDIEVSEIKENDLVQLIGNYRKTNSRKWNNIDQIEIVIGECKIINHTNRAFFKTRLVLKKAFAERMLFPYP